MQTRMRLGRLALHLVLTAGALLSALPFLWAITTSLKPARLTYTPPLVIPTHFRGRTT